MCSAGVVLQHEAAQELGLGRVPGAVQCVPVVTDHLSLADVRDLHEHVVAAPRVREDVLIIATPRQDLLAICDPLDRVQLVPISSCVLEIEAVRRGLHPVLELADQ